MPSFSSVLRGLKPSLFLPRMSPTLHSLALLGSPATGPRPLFLQRRTARHSASRRLSGTEMAAASSTLLLICRLGSRSLLGEEGEGTALGRAEGSRGAGEEGAPGEVRISGGGRRAVSVVGDRGGKVG